MLSLPVSLSGRAASLLWHNQRDAGPALCGSFFLLRRACRGQLAREAGAYRLSSRPIHPAILSRAVRDKMVISGPPPAHPRSGAGPRAPPRHDVTMHTPPSHVAGAVRGLPQTPSRVGDVASVPVARRGAGRASARAPSGSRQGCRLRPRVPHRARPHLARQRVGERNG